MICNLDEMHERFHERGCKLELCRDEDKDSLYEIFCEVVDTGTYFPYEASTQEEFQCRFFAQGTDVYVCRSADGQVLGGFYLKANCPGRSGHIANAAYMIREANRGMGLGRLLTEGSLVIAQHLGFTAMQYNMVLSRNERAVTLYKKLGFEIIATIQDAVRNPDGSYQAGYIMYRSLKE